MTHTSSLTTSVHSTPPQLRALNRPFYRPRPMKSRHVFPLGQTLSRAKTCGVRIDGPGEREERVRRAQEERAAAEAAAAAAAAAASGSGRDVHSHLFASVRTCSHLFAPVRTCSHDPKLRASTRLFHISPPIADRRKPVFLPQFSFKSSEYVVCE